MTLSLLLFQALVAGLEPSQTSQAGIPPWPDGAEYMDGAVHLFKEGRFAIHVGGETHPSRYPYGYSVLQVAALALGGDPVQAPYRVNNVAGLALLLSIFAWTAWRRSWVTGALAALLLAVQPSFVILCRAPMSEISAMLPTLWGVLLLYSFARGGSWKTAAAGSLLLGLALHFRLSALLLMGFVAAALAVRFKAQGRFPRRGLLACLGGLAAAAVPLALYHAVTFGAPWKTGYGYWLSSSGSPWALFSLSNLWPNLKMLALEAIQGEEQATTAFLVGEGSYFGPASLVLLALGVLYHLRQRTPRAFAAAGAIFLMGQLLYAYPLGRLYFPAVVLAVPAAAAMLAEVLPRLCKENRWGRLVPLCLLLLAALAGWPGKRSDSEIGDLWRSHPLGAFSLEYEAVQQIRARGEGPLLLLTDMNPPYLHAMLALGKEPSRQPLRGDAPDGQRSAGDAAAHVAADPWTAPLLDAHQYRFNPASFTFAEAQRQTLVDRALSQHRQVWAVTALYPAASAQQTFPAPAGYRWEVVWSNRLQGGVARLLPASTPR
ncbi:MAG TPA: hypothetical protein VLV83_22110 [Acidobacteriota bacterium]|nr:hypothetical protein [Acidobacteriota bacterium]